MAEEKGNRGDGKEKKEPQAVTVTLVAGDVKNRQIPVTAFAALGRRELAGKRIDFFVGKEYRPVATNISDATGRTSAVVDLPADAKGVILISAKVEGMAFPSAIMVDIPEEKKEEKSSVDKLDIEPTGLWYDEQEHSHILWTPRAFDESGKSVKAELHIVGARPFKIVGLVPPIDEERKIFDVKVSETPATYEIVVVTPELLEVDVFVQGVDLEEEFMLEGARKSRSAPLQGGGFFKHLKRGLGIGGGR